MVIVPWSLCLIVVYECKDDLTLKLQQTECQLGPTKENLRSNKDYLNFSRRKQEKLLKFWNTKYILNTLQ